MTMTPEPRVRRVVVVDDDDLSRRGIAEILNEDPKLSVISSLTHDEALDTKWDGVDVVLVDAADERRSDDHFPGVEVVRAIRRSRGPEETTVIVITGHFFDDAVRRRMREARADLFFHRTEVQDSDRLREVVAHPERERSSVPDVADAEAAFRLGIGDGARVNEAVQFAAEQGWLNGGLDAPGSTSRAWSGRRRNFARSSRVHAVNADGTPPDRHQNDPSRTQIAKLLGWATKSKIRPPG